MSDSAGRVYGGRSESERKADRRNRLIQAGFEVFGGEGWQAASIERLCARASVATRSFYEEFAGREVLMRAVYDDVVQQATVAVLEAMKDAPEELAGRIATGVGAYLSHVTEDPRRARIAYREVRQVGGLEEHRHLVMERFAELVQSGLTRPVLPADGARRRVLTLALAGAVSEVLVDWVATEPRPSIAPVREELVRLFTATLVPLEQGSGRGAVAQSADA